ncbi:hypothetical protein [Stieleria marina]|uniref:Uncharacterized protein n=1 Tax=Stieleria marina TaxID=1930275 RepID=A0A517NXR8_9BACT|nr:hypothetical protein K239x_39290 [Planctomycetes bacterium K23_9]
MHSETLIRTNHGVSYPFVGIKRVEQAKLKAADDQSADDAEGLVTTQDRLSFVEGH